MKVLVKNAALPVKPPPPPPQRHQCFGCGSICEVEHSDWRKVNVPSPQPILYWVCPVCEKRVHGSKAIVPPPPLPPPDRIWPAND
jgi:hypothetical protein